MASEEKHSRSPRIYFYDLFYFILFYLLYLLYFYVSASYYFESGMKERQKKLERILEIARLNDSFRGKITYYYYYYHYYHYLSLFIIIQRWKRI